MHKTIIKHLNIDLETGDIHVLLHKRAHDEAGNVVVQGNHRTVIHPGTDIDETAKGLNNHLASGQVPIDHASGATAKAAPVDLAEWEAVKQHAALARTPAVMKHWHDQEAARLAQQKIADEITAKQAEIAARQAAEAEARRRVEFDAAVAAAIEART
jgi:hypothetical protein